MTYGMPLKVEFDVANTKDIEIQTLDLLCQVMRRFSHDRPMHPDDEKRVAAWFASRYSR